MARRGDPLAEEAIGLLRGRGLRVTRARRAVIAELLRERRPMSHGEMLVALQGLRLDRATVYRVLVGLADADVLVRTDLGDRLWRFEVNGRSAENEHEHPHFVCTACQSISCLHGVSVEVSAPDSAPRAIGAQLYAVRLSGICDTCALGTQNVASLG